MTTDTRKQAPTEVGARLYRYGLSLAFALLVGNYVAWGTGILDARCVIGSVLAGALMLALTGWAMRP